MLDIGFLEIIVIGSLALIVVGPKDLPGLLRTVGQFVAKARVMARDFQKTMEDAARDADLGDVADVVKKGGKLGKNSIVDSLKEFETTVKSEVNDATAAVKSTASGASATAAAATSAKPLSATAAAITATPEVKPAPPRAKKASDGTATKKPASKAPAKAAAAKVPAKKPAAKKATAAKPASKTAAKPRAPKKAAAKPAASSSPAKSA